MLITISLIIYLVGAFVLMLFMYLIARFYRVKLDPDTQVAGFIGAMIAIIMAITGVLIGDNQNAERYFVDVAHFVAGLLGAWSSISLYIRMKKVYK